MSAVDRITAIVAEHRVEGRECAGCDWRWVQPPGGASVTSELQARDRAHAAHVAGRIAAADDLAVIELLARAPSTVEYWEAPVQVHRDSYGIHMGALIRFPAADEAVRQAAALLAAVKAAEAVSDR